jgi:hypothetical protein
VASLQAVPGPSGHRCRRCGENLAEGAVDAAGDGLEPRVRSEADRELAAARLAVKDATSPSETGLVTVVRERELAERLPNLPGASEVVAAQAGARAQEPMVGEPTRIEHVDAVLMIAGVAERLDQLHWLQPGVVRYDNHLFKITGYSEGAAMPDAYAVTTIDELPASGEADEGGAAWKSIRHHFDIQAFGASAYVAGSAGQRVVPEHDETSSSRGTKGAHEELYVVLSGAAEFTIGGEAVDAPAGTLVFVRDPDLVRTAHAREPGTIVLAFGGAAGEAFAVSPWETRSVAHA